MGKKKKAPQAPPRDKCSRCGRLYDLWYNQGGAHYSDDVEGQVHLFGDGQPPPNRVADHYGTYMFGSGRPALCIRCARAELGDER